MEWLNEIGVTPSRVRPLPIEEVIRDVVVDGPALEFADEIKALHKQLHQMTD